MIIPTVSNSGELALALDGLANQTYGDMEVVVVGPKDDGGRVEAESRGFRYDDKGAGNEQMLAMWQSKRLNPILFFSQMMT